MTIPFANRSSLIVWCSLVAACGPVSESDPQFWTPSRDLGAKGYDFAAPGNTATGGVTGAGGATQSTGGFVGGGGVDQSAGGIVQPSNGGDSSSGGVLGAGGDPSSGGVVGAGGVVTGGGGTTPTGGTTSVGTPGACKLTFSVTTVTANGRYAPDHVGAIWISDSTGKFVKALEVWGLRRLSNATAWTTASSGQKVDVVTQATLTRHRAHTLNWDCKDPSGNPVPFGTYQAHATFAESDSFPVFGPAPIEASMTFQRTGAPTQADGAATANFTGMRVVIE